MNRYRIVGKIVIGDAVEAGELTEITVMDPLALAASLPQAVQPQVPTVRLQCKSPPTPGNPPNPPEELVAFNLEFNAPDIESALEWGSEEFEARVAVLATLTLKQIEIKGALSCVEITPGKYDGLRSGHIAEEAISEPVTLSNDLLRHVMGGTAFAERLSPKLVGSFRWFRKGLAAVFPEDAFLYYWIALEMIATEFAVGESRFLQCPRCQTQFETCPNCEESTEMRPQASHGVIALFRDHLNWEKQKFRALNRTRSKLMHGNSPVTESLRQELVAGSGAISIALVRGYEVLLGIGPGKHPFAPRLELPQAYSARLYTEFSRPSNSDEGI